MVFTRNHRAGVRCLTLGVLALGLSWGLLPSHGPTGTAAPEPGKTLADAAAIRPFLQKHCVSCHGPETAKAGLRLDTLAAEFTDPEKARAWLKVHDRLK